MEVGRRKKEEAVIEMVSAIKNVLTVLAVAILVIILNPDLSSPLGNRILKARLHKLSSIQAD